jgi:hypothetical protein
VKAAERALCGGDLGERGALVARELGLAARRHILRLGRRARHRRGGRRDPMFGFEPPERRRRDVVQMERPSSVSCQRGSGGSSIARPSRSKPGNAWLNTAPRGWW